MATNPGILVAKFGGTSVGSVEAIRQAVSVIISTKATWPDQVVVVSAMSGVTNSTA